jgi:hypothetical protein
MHKYLVLPWTVSVLFLQPKEVFMMKNILFSTLAIFGFSVASMLTPKASGSEAAVPTVESQAPAIFGSTLQLIQVLEILKVMDPQMGGETIQVTKYGPAYGAGYTISITDPSGKKLITCSAQQNPNTHQSDINTAECLVQPLAPKKKK